MGESHRGERLHGLSSEVRQNIKQAVMEANLGGTAWEDWRKEYVSTWYLRGFPHQSQAEVDVLYEAIRAAIESVEGVAITRSSAAVDITPLGIDKGSGVIELCDKMEVPLSAVSYVGDGWNDWPAFEKTLASGGRGIFVGENPTLMDQLVQIGGELVPNGSRGLSKWLLEEL
jgi:hydroxymethylpyrimidine pyrophosphatase-like HAD family hydrolase